jgi:hypothetical protein
MPVAGSIGADTASSSPPAGAREISGVWYMAAPKDKEEFIAKQFLRPMDGGPLPFTETGGAIAKHRHDAADAGNPVERPSAVCMPPGVPQGTDGASPLQIIQTRGQVTMVAEYIHTVRLIYMDQKQPANPPPTFMGHSVGRWDGDTLVVDTIGQRAENWLDAQGTPVSAKLRITERIRKIDDGRKLEDVMTIDDPVMFTRPWRFRREYVWAPKDRVEEYICEENSARFEPGVPPIPN